jgi:hypothetical protein
MKNIFTGFALVILLFGCDFGNSLNEPIIDDVAIDEQVIAKVDLTDDLFIFISAEILCLPSNYPDSSSSEIETLAKQILVDAGVREIDFGTYQQTIEADPASKQELSLAILGKMVDFCEIEAITKESVETEDLAETEDSQGENLVE